MTQKKKYPDRYINGITIYNYKKIVDFVFGDHYDKIVDNQETMTFDIYLYRTVDGDEIKEATLKWFKEYWGPRLPIYIIEVAESS